jgi:hypothetical protein
MINNLAVHALLAAFADNKAIVDESSARTGVPRGFRTGSL